MKKCLKLFSLLLVSLLLVSALSSCGTKSKFVGTWVEIDSETEEASDNKIVFASDGTGTVTSDGIGGTLTWSVDGDKLSMTMSICGMTTNSEFTYEFSGDKLTLTDSESGDVTVYRKG